MADHEEPLEETSEEESHPEKGFLNPTDHEALLTGQDQGYRIHTLPQLVDPSKAWKFDEKARDVYLRAIVMTGGKEIAASIAGVTTQTVRMHARSDKDFAALELQAIDMYKARLNNELNHQAFEGDYEPIVGRIGRDQDGILGFRRVKNFNALKMLAQKHDAGHRHQGGGTGEGGARPSVLVVFPVMEQKAWADATAGELLTKNPLEGIPGTENLMLEDRTPRGRIPDED